MNTQAQHTKRKMLGVASLSLLPFISLAADNQEIQTVSYFSNALFNTLLVVIILLAIMVTTLSRALKNIVSSDLFLEKVKRDKERAASKTGKIAGLFLLFSLISFSGMAQEVEKVIEVRRIGGLDYTTFYLMATVIFLELVTLLVLFNTFKNILGYETLKAEAAAAPAVKTKTLFEKMNYTVDIEDEGTIMIDHDYDGIKELNNDLPPWWKYGFYLTIIVAILYLLNYHVFRSSPLQADEYKNSIKKAELDIAEFMKTSANNVDENSVKLLTDASDIAAGKEMFVNTCAACHGRGGEGGVGPNLTDDYWIHSGSVKEIFKTIKYGWPDKGMKSWKEDFSPMQISQLTSFIRTLRGTNPANPKDKQGELYIETAMPSDSTAVKADSTAVLTDSLKVALQK